jgi:hypothetical protein
VVEDGEPQANNIADIAASTSKATILFTVSSKKIVGFAKEMHTHMFRTYPILPQKQGYVNQTINFYLAARQFREKKQITGANIVDFTK